MHDESFSHPNGEDFCCPEIENFVDIVRRIRPPSQPMPHGTIDVYGSSIFLNGAAGGDHIIYLDFDERYDIDRRIRQAVEAGNDSSPPSLTRFAGASGFWSRMSPATRSPMPWRQPCSTRPF